MKFYEQFVHWEPSFSLLTDWRTDMKIVTVAFQNSAKAPKAGTYSTRKEIRLLWRVIRQLQSSEYRYNYPCSNMTPFSLTDECGIVAEPTELLVLHFSR